jgi:hypothetical protein
MPKIELRVSGSVLGQSRQVDLGLTDGDGPETQMVLTNRYALIYPRCEATKGPGAMQYSLRDLDGNAGNWTDGEIIALAGLLGVITHATSGPEQTRAAILPRAIKALNSSSRLLQLGRSRIASNRIRYWYSVIISRH